MAGVQAEFKPDSSRLQARGLNIAPDCSLKPPVVHPWAFKHFDVTFPFIKLGLLRSVFLLEQFDLVPINIRCWTFQERVCCLLGVFCVERDVRLDTGAA